MKYVQINSFYNGSTGNIMRGLHEKLLAEGHDSYIFWGRRHGTISEREQCCATSLGVYSHGICARLTDRVGFYSKHDTARLLAKLDEIDPDVVHLHNIHGYYINVEMLFRWLANRNQRTYWTLHDCWAFTGHCSYFVCVQCEQWKHRCSQDYRCPQKTEYPRSYLLDSSGRNFDEKRRLFNLLPADRMVLITPSQWLADLVKQSYLSKYPVKVQYNAVNGNVFRPTPNDFRERMGIGNRLLVLGVSSPWSPRKGLEDFISMAAYLDDSYAIVLVGLDSKQISKSIRAIRKGEKFYANRDSRFAQALIYIQSLGQKKAEESSHGGCYPKCIDAVRSSNGCNVILLKRTESQRDLSQMYSAADVFFNPTREDNYPTVNLEAQACGTPVYTYDTGGCPETLWMPESKVIKNSEGH